MTDRELLEAYLSTGAQDAFAEIVDRYSGMVFSTCLRILGDTHWAEDAAQITFLTLMRNIRSLPPENSLALWLYATARNSALNTHKKEMRRKRRERGAAMQTPLNKEHEQLWETLRPQIDHALAALPGQQRDAIVMRYIRGLSHATAAREMNCSKETFHSRLRLGLEKLREKLQVTGSLVPLAALALLLEQRMTHAAPESVVASLKAVCLNQAPQTIGRRPLKPVAVSATVLLVLAGVTCAAWLSRRPQAPKADAGDKSPPAATTVRAGAEELQPFDDENPTVCAVTGKVVDMFKLPPALSDDIRITHDGRTIWAMPRGYCTKLYKLNPATGALIGELPLSAPVPNCTSLGYRDALFLFSAPDKKGYRVDPQSGTISETFDLPLGPQLVSFKFSDEWVSLFRYSGKEYDNLRLNLRTKAVERGSPVFELTDGPIRFYASSRAEYEAQLHPADGRELNHTVGLSAWKIGSQVWVLRPGKTMVVIKASE